MPDASASGKLQPIVKRPCANCPFRKDEGAIELRPGRLEGIVADLKADQTQTFVCHKTLDKERKTCAGAVGFMSKLDQLPLVAILARHYGYFTEDDIAKAESMVIEPADLAHCGEAPGRRA